MDILNYGARWYDPLTGRFLQPDTIVPEPFNPQSLNRYSYCLNNPIKYTDPTGQEYSEDVGSPSGTTLDDLYRLTDTFEVTGMLMAGGTSSLAQLRAAQNLVGAFRNMGYGAALDWYMNTTDHYRDMLAGALLVCFTYSSCGDAVFDIHLQIQNPRPTHLCSGLYSHEGDPTNGIGPRTFRLSAYLTQGDLTGTISNPSYSISPSYLEELVRTTSHEPSHMADWLSVENSIQIAGSVENMNSNDISLWESLQTQGGNNNENYDAYRASITEERAFAREDSCWHSFFYR